MTRDGTAPPDSSARVLAADAAAVGLLLALVLWYFAPHVRGTALFVGDSDRMSHFFTWLIHLNEGIRHGRLPTWNNSLFGGYSTAGLPYVYYNPLAFAGLMFDRELQNWVAGWTSLLLLWLAGISAYALIRRTIPSAFCAFVGAALYESSAVLVLKISQNEGTFSVTVLTPLILLSVQAAVPGRLLRWTLISSAAFTYLFTVSFLQEAAYACMLVAAFVLFRLFRHREWTPVLVATAASIPAFLLSVPRLVNVGLELTSSNRAATGGLQQAWQSLGAFNQFEVLRILDDRILGRYFSHALALGNAINLHEGMVAYVSTYGVVAVLFGLASWVARDRHGHLAVDIDVPFHVLFAIFCLSVPVTKTGYAVMYYLFAKIGFIHARVTTVAMPSLCLLVAVFLHRMALVEDHRGGVRASTTLILIVIAACVLVTAVVEIVAQRFVDVPWPLVLRRHVRAAVSVGAAIRVGASLVIGVTLMASALWVHSLRRWRPTITAAVGILAVMQVAVYAKDQTSGPFMLDDGLPYRTPTRLLAKADEFLVPSDTARARMHAILQPELYRTAFICDPARIGIYCTPYIATAWQLREIGGYVSAIPSRIAALPWPTSEVGLRSITLHSLADANWGLLAFLNVQYVVDYHPALLTNAVPGGPHGVRELRPSDLVIHRNPIAAVPRAFFARKVVTRASISEVVASLFPEGIYDPARADVRGTSYVEGPASLGGRYAVDGDIRADFRDQFVDIRVSPMAAPRFLVINERYHTGWRAYADGAEIPIVPTNVFMRGLVVPATAHHIRLEFRPFSLSRRAVPLYAAGATTLVAVVIAARRVDHRVRRPR